MSKTAADLKRGERIFSTDKAGRPHKLMRHLKKAWIRELGRQCELCGVKMTNPSRNGIQTETTATVDHIVPLCLGGRNQASNLRVICYSCNSQKGVEENPTDPEWWKVYCD